MLPNKWRYDTSHDWEIIRGEFDSFSSDTIPDNILQALRFHLSFLGYLEKEAPLFVDVTEEPELTIEPEPMADDQPITDSEDEKVKKGLERITKRKA